MNFAPFLNISALLDAAKIALHLLMQLIRPTGWLSGLIHFPYLRGKYEK